MNALRDTIAYRERTALKPPALYAQAWWLDAVAGVDGWAGLIVPRDKDWAALLPLYVNKRYGFRRVMAPALAYYGGPVLSYPPGGKNPARYSFEVESLGALLRVAAGFDNYNIRVHPDLTNGLPFRWAGFRTEAAWTYRFPDLSAPVETMLEEAKSSMRRAQRAAAQVQTLRLTQDADAARLFLLASGSARRQGRALPYGEHALQRLAAEAIARGQGAVLIAETDAGAAAGAFVAWDDRWAYMVVQAVDDAQRDAQAGVWLTWEAVRYVRRHAPGRGFDFLGSMLPAVEPGRRATGAVLTPYLTCTRTPSRLLRMYNTLRRRQG